LLAKELSYVHSTGQAVIKAKPAVEGAGVRLRRAFGFEYIDFDPFLLLDGLSNDVPEDLPAGFPWHPHRGIETITYVLARNRGSRRTAWKQRLHIAGDVPMDGGWTGNHPPEMPKGDALGQMHRLPVVANLPASVK